MAEILSLFSRRNMLLGVAGTATVGGIAAAQRFTSADSLEQLLRPVQLGRRGVPLGSAEVDDWSLQVGSMFTAHTGHLLKLVDVQRFREDKNRPAGLRAKAFVARFDVAEGGAMPGEAIYRVNHPEGGVFDILLSGGIPGNPLRVAAVFN
jgi:hypothetical protein